MLSSKEGELLYTLAKNCTGKGCIVEIGSYKGKSTAYLGMGSKEGKKIKVYAIDPHDARTIPKQEDTFSAFQRNIKKAGVANLIVPLVMTSKEAVEKIKEPIELIFIDGDHSYEGVKLDFDLYFPKVIDGGIIAFHDTNNGHLGVQKLVEKLMLKSHNLKNFGVVGSIAYATKVQNNTLRDRYRNRCVLVHKLILEFIILLCGKLPECIKKTLKAIIYETNKN